MKYLSHINESKSDRLDQLKDSLNELSDNKEVLFLSEKNKIFIAVKLNKYFNFNLRSPKKDDYYNCYPGIKYSMDKMDKIQLCMKEIFEITNLLKEGLERSQIDYNSVIIDVGETWFDSISGDVDDKWIDDDDIILFTIK